MVEFWWRMGWSWSGGSGSSREAGRHPGGRQSRPGLRRLRWREAGWERNLQDRRQRARAGGARLRRGRGRGLFLVLLRELRPGETEPPSAKTDPDPDGREGEGERGQELRQRALEG